MSSHTIQLVATKGVFKGLASQNMLFHQCIVELVDNAIAASASEKKFRVDIYMNPRSDTDVIDVFVADSSNGMSLGLLKKALQLGESATEDNRLNEHGFGLKNALATLSGKNGAWTLWTKELGTESVSSVEGPFRPEMTVSDEASFPSHDFLPADMSTLIHVGVRLSFVQTLQGRGAPAKDLSALREWLIEHLGVLYRGYLEQDPEKVENDGVITVSIVNDTVHVAPIAVPLGDAQVKYFDVELGGMVRRLEYRHGVLDDEKRDRLVKGKKAKYYYQGNQPSQGIDIRLGKRVIATRQLETIWKTNDGTSQLQRHNKFNDFVGELIIPELPRGILTTVNNKTDFNLDDVDWVKIFDKLAEFRPREKARERSEAEMRDKWIEMLKATNPEETVNSETTVWPTGTKIDVYRRTTQGKVIVYELKVGTGSPIDLYQLKMYWDGLVLHTKESPGEAILLAEDFDAKLEEMANMMNKLPVSEGSKPYNFKIERLASKGLSRKN